MKLNLIFIVMNLLTLLAYPIVFVHGKLYEYLKTTNLLVSVSAAPQR
jgi:hypothetical protein